MSDIAFNNDKDRVSAELAFAPAKKATLLDLVQRAQDLEESLGSCPEEMLEELKAEALLVLDGVEKKVDGYAGMIAWHMKRRACAQGELAEYAKPEVERLKKRVEREEAAADRLRHLALFVMRVMNTKKLEGEKVTLKALGVADSCEVTDESAVPVEYKPGTVTMSLDNWGAIVKAWQSYRGGNADALMSAIGIAVNENPTIERQVDKKELLAALKAKCVECKGSGELVTVADPGEMLPSGNLAEPQPCPKCNGRGTTLIPGARLLTGKQRLVIE